MKDDTNRKSWIIAGFFLTFEALFWASGIDFVRATVYMVEDGKPFIAAADRAGVFHSWWEAALSLMLLIASIWCMKQFVRCLVTEIRKNGHSKKVA